MEVGKGGQRTGQPIRVATARITVKNESPSNAMATPNHPRSRCLERWPARPMAMLKDVSLEDVELDLLWQFLGKDSFKYWLAWSRIGTDLAINNDTRLREMIQTQKEIADESREVEELPVYALSLRKGRTPIDKADHLLALILVSVCVVLCWLIGLSVGSRVGMELKFITSALFL
jgi:hypothetical protein